MDEKTHKDLFGLILAIYTDPFWSNLEKLKKYQAFNEGLPYSMIHTEWTEFRIIILQLFALSTHFKFCYLTLALGQEQCLFLIRFFLPFSISTHHGWAFVFCFRLPDRPTFLYFLFFRRFFLPSLLAFRLFFPDDFKWIFAVLKSEISLLGRHRIFSRVGDQPQSLLIHKHFETREPAICVLKIRFLT